jgi:hypothetical protein
VSTAAEPAETTTESAATAVSAEDTPPPEAQPPTTETNGVHEQAPVTALPAEPEALGGAEDHADHGDMPAGSLDEARSHGEDRTG